MSATEAGVKALDTILGHLGFQTEISVEEGEENICLQVQTEFNSNVIGRHGERLDDLQYLVNRIVQKEFPDSPRFKVDCNHYREETEERLRASVLEHAERVKETGEPHTMRPLNGYYRRLVHNVVVDDPEIETASPRSEERLKRIVISKRA